MCAGSLDSDVVFGLAGDETGFYLCYLSYESRHLVDVEETSYHSSWRTGYLRGPARGGGSGVEPRWSWSSALSMTSP